MNHVAVNCSCNNLSSEKKWAIVFQTNTMQILNNTKWQLILIQTYINLILQKA